MNTRIILSLVSALALFCAAPNSIAAFQRLVFGAPAAYAGQADAPEAASSAQPESAGSGSASGNIGEPARVPGERGSAVASPTAHEHPLVIRWGDRRIPVPHDSEQCAQVLLFAIINKKAVPIQDKECRAVMAQIIEIQRKEALPFQRVQYPQILRFHRKAIPIPPKPAKGELIEMHTSGFLTIGDHILPADGKCAAPMVEALEKNHTVPAPNDFCRALMLEALEVQRNAPPVEANPAAMPPEAPPPGTPRAPGEPAAECAAPNVEGSAPRRALVPGSPFIVVRPNGH